MPRLVRLERWSDRESNGGTRQDICPSSAVLVAEEYRELNAREELTLQIDPAHSWATDLVERMVVRTVFADDTYDEWRVWVVKSARRGDGSRSAGWLCRSAKFDLSDELALFPQADGKVFAHYELADLPIEDFLDVLMALDEWPADFTKGTVDPSTRYTWVLDWDTYLAALVEAATVGNAELDVRRNGSSGYIVDLLDEVASGSRTEIRFRANALEAEVERDWTEAGTLIFPKGEGPQGEAPSIGDMRFWPEPLASLPTDSWRLYPWDGTARPSGGFLGLLTPAQLLVISEDDQFNGLYFAGVEITDSAIADSGRSIDVTLASSITRPAGTQHIRANADGDELLYLPVPSKIATHGRRAVILEREDIPGITNLCSLPFLGGKKGVHWRPIGAPTIGTEFLAAGSPYVKYGRTSIKVTAEAEEGIGKFVNRQGGNDSWMVSTQRPHLSFQVYGHLESGSVKLEVRFKFVSPVADSPVADGREYVFPVGNDGSGNPIEARAIAGGGTPFHLSIEPAAFNFAFADDAIVELGFIQDLELRLIAREAGTVFYADAFQVRNHPTRADKFVTGSSMLRLWDAGIRAVLEGDLSEPRVRLRTTALDFNRLGTNPLTGATYTYGEMKPGVTARIVDSGIGLDEEHRIRSVRRDLKREALTALELLEVESA